MEMSDKQRRWWFANLESEKGSSSKSKQPENSNAREKTEQRKKTAEQKSGVGDKREAELRQRRAADKWVEERLPLATGAEVHVLNVIKEIWGTPEQGETGKHTIRLAQGPSTVMNDAAPVGAHSIPQDQKPKKPDQQSLLDRILAIPGQLLPPDARIESRPLSDDPKEGYVVGPTWDFGSEWSDGIKAIYDRDGFTKLAPLPDPNQNGGLLKIGVRLPKGFVDLIVNDGWKGLTEQKKSRLYEKTTDMVAGQIADIAGAFIPAIVKGELRQDAKNWVKLIARAEFRKYAPDNWLKRMTDAAEKKMTPGNFMRSSEYENSKLNPEQRKLRELEDYAASDRGGPDLTHPGYGEMSSDQGKVEPHKWLKQQYRDSPKWFKDMTSKTPNYLNEFYRANSHRLKAAIGEERYNDLFSFQIEFKQEF